MTIFVGQSLLQKVCQKSKTSLNFQQSGQLGQKKIYAKFDPPQKKQTKKLLDILPKKNWTPLPDVGCPKSLEIQNPWEKYGKEVVSYLNIFAYKWSKTAAAKKVFYNLFLFYHF